MDSVQSVKETFINTLSKQLSELDLLKSMYPNQGEIVITNCYILDDIKKFVENKSISIPNHLDFVLKLNVDEFKLEVYVNLPSLYPEEEPDLYVRCNQLNRHQETTLNSELSQYIKSIHENEVCVYTAISWLQENIDTFKVKTEVVPKHIQALPESKKDKPPAFVRLWIFSHHIYNKFKREEILKRAKEFHLTGFCLPGKPGIICIEGVEEDCSEWWRGIKSLNWKKISLRKTVVFDISEKETNKQFEDFQEISFHNHSSKGTKTGFSKYIEEHNLSQEFNEFLGL